MEVVGYKCFNKDLINNYGKKFEVGKIYIATGKIKFGTSGNGFHLCKNIEDTFRYFDALKEDVDVCLVKGSGEFQEYEDNYYGYYDMYSFEKLEIIKKLTRKEIIELGLKMGGMRAKRFVSTYKLNPTEIDSFKKKYMKELYVLDAISYHQEGDVKVYERKIKK